MNDDVEQLRAKVVECQRQLAVGWMILEEQKGQFQWIQHESSLQRVLQAERLESQNDQLKWLSMRVDRAKEALAAALAGLREGGST
jgi:hypothetical protein